MLYGVQRDRQEKLTREGQRVRVYIPPGVGRGTPTSCGGWRNGPQPEVLPARLPRLMTRHLYRSFRGGGNRELGATAQGASVTHNRLVAGSKPAGPIPLYLRV